MSPSGQLQAGATEEDSFREGKSETLGPILESDWEEGEQLVKQEIKKETNCSVVIVLWVYLAYLQVTDPIFFLGNNERAICCGLICEMRYYYCDDN